MRYVWATFLLQALFVLPIAAQQTDIVSGESDKTNLNIENDMDKNNIEELSMLYPKFQKEVDKCLNLEEESKMCAKQPMEADGIVRLSKIEVYPEYLEEYKKFAMEVGEVSLQTEPGVLTMYAVQEKEHPCRVTILETYVSQEAYKKHIASDHFQKYKKGTLHMVKTLDLLDQTPLNPANRINNYIQ